MPGLLVLGCPTPANHAIRRHILWGSRAGGPLKSSNIPFFEGPIELQTIDRDGNEHYITVLPAPYERNRLQMELTPQNVELLLLKPGRVVGDTFRPHINEPNVTYLPYKKALKATFKNTESGKSVVRTLPISAKTHVEMQARADKAQKELQNWYDVNAPKDA